MKLVFLAENTRVALTRFCTWLMTLINSLDEQVDEQDFVYAIPVLFVDIPFELFRAMLRALTGEERFEDDINKPATKVGCLAQTSFQASLATFISRHFFDDKIANPDLKEMMIIRLNMFLQF